MVKSKLSDKEWVDILSLVNAGDLDGLHSFMDRLLYDKGLGTDCCARPFAIREKEQLEHPCFAVGYLEKIDSFMMETAGRTQQNPSEVIGHTHDYIADLKKEINRFFKKG